MNIYLDLRGNEFNVFEKCNITSFSDVNLLTISDGFALSLSQCQS